MGPLRTNVCQSSRRLVTCLRKVHIFIKLRRYPDSILILWLFKNSYGNTNHSDIAPLSSNPPQTSDDFKMITSAPPSYREPSVIVDVDEPAPTYTPQNILVTDTVKVVLKTSNSDTNHTNNNNTIIPNQQTHEQAQQQQAQQLRSAKRSGCSSCVKSLIITVFFITLFLLPVIIDVADSSRTWCWVWEEDCHSRGESNVTRNATASASVSTSLTDMLLSETNTPANAASSTDSLFSVKMDVGTESTVSTTRATEEVLERRYNGLQTTFATRTRDVFLVQRTGN